MDLGAEVTRAKKILRMTLVGPVLREQWPVAILGSKGGFSGSDPGDWAHLFTYEQVHVNQDSYVLVLPPALMYSLLLFFTSHEFLSCPLPTFPDCSRLAQPMPNLSRN